MTPRRLAMTIRSFLLAALFAGPLAAADGTGSCLLMTSRDSGELVLLRTATFQVVARVPVGDGPHEVVASADGQRAFVANYGQQTPGRSLSVIDLGSAKETARIDLGALRRPHGLAVAGDALYLTAEANRAVARIDTKTLEIDWLMGLGVDINHMLAANADGSRLYTTNLLSDSVSELRLHEKGPLPPLRHLPIAGRPEGLALSPDGRTLWVGRNSHGRISIVDVEHWQVSAELEAGQMPFRLQFSPDGARVAVMDPPGGALRLYDAGSRALLHTIALAAPGGAAYSFDSRRLYAALLGSQSVVEIDVASGQVLREAQAGPISDGIALAGRDCAVRAEPAA